MGIAIQAIDTQTFFGIFAFLALFIFIGGTVLITTRPGIQRLLEEMQIESKAFESASRPTGAAGEIGTLISFALLVLAYGIFGQDQTRDLGSALQAIVTEHLDEVMPAAILTQFTVLSASWVLFGSLTGIKPLELLRPASIAVGGVIFLAMLLVYAAAFMSLTDGDWLPSAVAFPLLLALVYGIAVLGATPEIRAARLERLRLTGRSEIILGRYRRDRIHDPAERLRLKPKYVLLTFWLFLLLLTMIALVTGVVVAVKGDGLPGWSQVVRGCLIGSAFTGLYAMHTFRKHVLDRVQSPPALLPLIDLTLAISACTIAVTGLATNHIVLGTIPSWIVATIPPLAVTALIYFTQLRPARRLTARWNLCLGAALIAGLLVGPAKEILGFLFGPAAARLPMPF